MSKHAKHVPKHRHTPARSAVPRKALRTTVVLSSIAAATTGVTVSGGLLAADAPESTPAAATTAAAAQGAARPPSTTEDSATTDEAAELLADRGEEPVSRSDRRAAADPNKVASLDQDSGGAMAGAEDLSDADPREIGRVLLGEFGFGDDQFGCLDKLFVSESNWRVDADNPTSSAYGIPQALTQLHDLPDDYMTNPVTQIRWGLEYIERRYGSPCSAWSFKQGHNWY